MEEVISHKVRKEEIIKHVLNKIDIYVAKGYGNTRKYISHEFYILIIHIATLRCKSGISLEKCHKIITCISIQKYDYIKK
jgi:hypothetical protein